jgi:hypothetical protein
MGAVLHVSGTRSAALHTMPPSIERSGVYGRRSAVRGANVTSTSCHCLVCVVCVLQMTSPWRIAGSSTP